MDPELDGGLVERVAGVVARLLTEHHDDEVARVRLDFEWLTPRQAGAYLKLTERSLEALRAAGTGPPFHKFSGRVRYGVVDLRAWNKQPVATSPASAPGRISAALWSDDGATIAEVTSDPDPQMHIVAVLQSTFDAELFFDERRAWRRTVQPGSVAIVSAGRRPRAIHRGRTSILHLYMPSASIDDLASEASGRTLRGVELIDPQCLSADPALFACAREIEREMREPAALSRLRIDGLAQDVAVHLVRRHTGLRFPQAARTAPRPDDWRLRRAMEALSADIAHDPGLDALAATVGLTPRRLTTLFREGVGMAPHRWLTQRRLARACDLLAGSRLPVTEIALACGFANAQHFATRFRASRGVTPSEYRRRRL